MKQTLPFTAVVEMPLPLSCYSHIPYTPNKSNIPLTGTADWSNGVGYYLVEKAKDNTKMQCQRLSWE
jgi:hypothetical protein